LANSNSVIVVASFVLLWMHCIAQVADGGKKGSASSTDMQIEFAKQMELLKAEREQMQACIALFAKRVFSCARYIVVLQNISNALESLLLLILRARMDWEGIVTFKYIIDMSRFTSVEVSGLALCSEF
jgi:hypothetical protein